MTAPVITASVDDDSNDDCRKAFLSRIPQSFTTETIKNLLETNFGIDCVSDVVIVYDRSTDTNEGGSNNAHRSDNATVKKSSDKQQHRGFGFVTFTTQEQYQNAIDSGTVRGSMSIKSHRKYTLYIRPVIRSDDINNNNYHSGTMENDVNVTTNIPKEDELKNICFLWTKHRCPYGTNCKFIHFGEGGCSTTTSNGDDVVTSLTNKKTKIKTKKQKKDDDNMKTTTKEENDKSQIDCINYKNKGKCRKGDKCPYRHDANSLRNNKKKKKHQLPTTSDTMDDSTTITMKKRQSLCIRVFGLNYTTTEKDVHDYFAHCGKIMEITFPTYEDSGRSKGYCGVLFTSPKAVLKAVALDGGELHGRWLRIQEGKMYLKKWEEAESNRSCRKEGSERLGNSDDFNSGGDCETGEYGQKVKRRKKHGFKDE